jgi:hypothetical protein
MPHKNAKKGFSVGNFKRNSSKALFNTKYVYNANFDFINNIISSDTECISCISRSDGGREVSGGGVVESSHKTHRFG